MLLNFKNISTNQKAKTKAKVKDFNRKKSRKTKSVHRLISSSELREREVSYN